MTQKIDPVEKKRRKAEYNYYHYIATKIIYPEDLKERHKKNTQKYKRKPENRIKILEGYKRYRNIPEIKEKRKLVKRTEEYKNVRNKRRRERRVSDIQYMLALRLHQSLRKALIKYSISGKKSSSEKYGIDWEPIIKKLTPLPFPVEEREKWHIDHILPMSSFNLENPEEVKKCFSPENLQWLPGEENLKKSDKMPNEING